MNRFFGLLLMVLVVACQQSDNPGKTPLSLAFREDGSVNGVYDGGDYNNISLKWKFTTGSAVRGTPLYNNDRIYVGSGDSNFYALDATNGALIWKFKAEAAIHSSAALSDDRIIFMDRADNLYALDKGAGTPAWKVSLGKPMTYDWGFDYYQASPVIVGGIAYVGSGDGNFYALSTLNGKMRWTFPAGTPIRAPATASAGLVYFGDFNGKVYAIDSASGKPKWVFSTIGDTLKNDAFGFDRKAILAKPAVKDGNLIIGSRDGYLYCLDINNGKEKWKYNYDISWVISSVAISDTLVISGTSDGKIVNCLGLKSGREIWRAATNLVWSSPVITGNTVLTAQNDGFLYLHDLPTGKEKNRIRIGDRFFSTPVFYRNSIFVGNDNGNIYSFNAFTDSALNIAKAAKKTVFWTKDPVYSFHKYGIDAYIRDFFVAEGYQLLNEYQLGQFMAECIKDTVSSVIVLASNYLPEKIITGRAKESLVYKYLADGGKIVATGLNPAVYDLDFKKKEFKGYNYALSDSLIGIPYPYKDLRSHRGFFASKVTDMGKRWGLTESLITNSAYYPGQVTALAIDETGNAAYWVKNYGHHDGTGFVQLWINPDNLAVLKQIKAAAEYGLSGRK